MSLILLHSMRLAQGPQQDYCGTNGARLLISKIEAFWRGRGFEPPVFDLIGDDDDHGRRQDIRSDMRNGLPRRRA